MSDCRETRYKITDISTAKIDPETLRWDYDAELRTMHCVGVTYELVDFGDHWDGFQIVHHLGPSGEPLYSRLESHEEAERLAQKYGLIEGNE